MDTLLPGSAAMVASSSALINRTLARVLRFARRARVALVGPATPLTPRLHAYGCEILGGFQVRDVEGLAALIAAGGMPCDFGRFGRHVHIRDRVASSVSMHGEEKPVEVDGVHKIKIASRARSGPILHMNS